MFFNEFSNVDGARGAAAGKYYISPDYSEFQDRISGNLKHAWKFKTPSTSDKTYITISCKDIKNYCGKKSEDSKTIGDYGWIDNGWWGYYHYITLCPSFFTVDNLTEQIEKIEKELSRGEKKMATDMRYLQTTGQYFLHELTHTRLVYDDQPEIIDEYIFPPDGGPGARFKAYGPWAVHKLANLSKSRGGEATRGSTNADSYAMLANCLWWWDVTGYFPAAVPPPRIAQANSIEEGLLFLHVDIGKNQCCNWSGWLQI